MNISLVVQETFDSNPHGLEWGERIRAGDRIKLVRITADANLVFYTRRGFTHHISDGKLRKVVDEKELFLALLKL